MTKQSRTNTQDSIAIHLVYVFSVSLCFCCFGSPTSAQEPIPAGLAVYPPEVNLATSRGQQMFVVQAVYPDGITRDVTALAKTRLANPALVKLDKNALTPLADGATELIVEHAGRALTVPIKVKDAKAERPISFKLDVMPIFMRTGCNAGGCHGAARGKDGFRLSLFGFDPDGDHYRLTREINGRRINLALPAESLLLEKITGKVPHTGGQQHQGGRPVPPEHHALARGRRSTRSAHGRPADRRRSVSP